MVDNYTEVLNNCELIHTEFLNEKGRDRNSNISA